MKWYFVVVVVVVTVAVTVVVDPKYLQGDRIKL